MAGSPRKRARKMGLALPNVGDKPPQWPRARARDLPSDEALARIAKATLLDVMCLDTPFAARDRVAAARAILEATRHDRPATSELEALSDEELKALASQASETLGSGTTQ